MRLYFTNLLAIQMIYEHELRIIRTDFILLALTANTPREKYRWFLSNVVFPLHHVLYYAVTLRQDFHYTNGGEVVGDNQWQMPLGKEIVNKVYSMEYANISCFVMLCFVVVFVSVSFTHIFQGNFTGDHEENETDEHVISIYYEEMI